MSETTHLETENARLRSRLSDEFEENARMVGENARLRELIRDMWREMVTCPDYARSPCLTSSICERMRKLEIEAS